MTPWRCFTPTRRSMSIWLPSTGAEPQPSFDHYLQQLMIYGFGQRILFGSDQMTWPEATEQAVARFRSAAYLTAEQRADIFFNNAVRLFGWTDLTSCHG